MKSKNLIKEDIVSDVSVMHADHQVQMARKECYDAAEAAVTVHQMLKDISDVAQIEPWVIAKLSLAAEYLNAVKDHLCRETPSIDVQVHTIDDGYPEIDFGSEFDRMMGESVGDGWNKFEDWKQAVLAAYPEVASKIKFVSQDNGQHISAEVPGMDRSYGFYDMNTDECEVLGESTFDRGHGNIIDAFNTEKYGRVQWTLAGGVNFISSQLPNQERKMLASGDSKEIAAKWARIKKHLYKPSDTMIGENSTGGATSSASVATAFSGKNKKEVGSLFGGAYQQNTPFHQRKTKKK